jgi:hypothetical protein
VGRLLERFLSSSSVPPSTLRKWVKRERDGVVDTPKRRGPAPLLPAEAEQTIADWITERQRIGRPVDRQAVLNKAGEVR